MWSKFGSPEAKMWSNFGSCENNEKLGKTLFSQLGHNYAVVIQLCSSCKNNVWPSCSLFSQLRYNGTVVRQVVKIISDRSTTLTRDNKYCAKYIIVVTC